MHNFKAVIFDMDGLLLDSEKLALKAFNSTCESYDLGDLSDLFKQCIGTNNVLGRSILQNGLEGLVDFEVFHQSWEALYLEATTAKPVPLKEGVVELLQHIQSLKIPMAVATSTKTTLAKDKLSHSELIHWFDVIIGGDQVAQSKPNPHIYLKASEALAVEASDCLALEDSANGVKAAVAAGMTVVQIPDLVQPNDELRQMGHIVLDSLLDVPSYQYPT